MNPVALPCNSWRHRDLLRTPLACSSEARFLVFWQVHQHSHLPTVCMEQLPQLRTETFAATLNVKEGRTFEQSRVTEQEWLHTCFVNVQCLLDSHRKQHTLYCEQLQHLATSSKDWFRTSIQSSDIQPHLICQSRAPPCTRDYHLRLSSKLLWEANGLRNPQSDI